MKQALLDIARDTGLGDAVPSDQAGWAALAERLGIKAIHIAERDTQVAQHRPRRSASSSTPGRSTASSARAASRPSSAGARTRRRFPADGHRHDFGCDAAIYLMRPGAGTRVRSWTPLEGPMHGFLVTHNESISIADYFTARDGNGAVRYRPTVHYAYHPCDDAVLSVHELAGKNWRHAARQRLMMDEITSGMDELGVLLMGHAKNAYWYGSRLSIERGARAGAAQQRDQPAGDGGGAGRAGLGDGEPARRHRRGRRDRPPRAAGDHAALSRRSGRRLLRLDAAARTAASRSRRRSTTSDPWQFTNIRVT